MIVYYIMYILILLGTPLVARTGKTLEQRNRRAGLWIVVLIALVVGLRHPSMGNDLRYGSSYGYIWSFQRIAKYSFPELLSIDGWLNYGWGYILYNKLLSCFSEDVQWLLFASAIASIVPVGNMIRKYSKDLAFSAVVYLGMPCFLMAFSGLRQAIAIGICCGACSYIQQRKPLGFAVVMLLAVLFHSSAIVFMIAYPLYHLKVSKKIRLLTFPCLAVIYAARYPLFSVASKLFKDDAVAEETNAITLLLVFVLVYAFCTVFLKDNDEVSSGFLNLFYFTCICQCFGGVYSVAMRVGYYFMPALAIALPNIIANMENPNNYKLSQGFVMAAFVAYGLYALYTNGNSWPMTYPYHFFWSELML